MCYSSEINHLLMRFRQYTLLYRRLCYVHNVKIVSQQVNVSHVKTLCKYVNVSESKAQYLSLKYPVINKLNDERMRSLIENLHDIGFSGEVLVEEPALFGILPITLKFRHKVLKECGIEHVTPKLISTYLTVMRQKTIGELKKSSKITAHMNVENRLASYMTQWPTSLTTLIYEDINNTTLYSLRLKIIQRYLELILDLTNEAFLRGIETYPTIKHRPLEYINETLNILRSQILMPDDKIKSNMYLVHANPDNIKNLLFKCRTIGGIDIKDVVRLHPKLVLKNYQSVLEISKIFEEYGISHEAQRRCFDIFTLSPETVRERLEKAKTTPEFSMFFNHPRFLKMIHYNKTATKRIHKLYESNKKCLSLNILSGSSAHYTVFEKAPGDRLGKGKDLLFCISQCLGKKYNMSHLSKTIRRHPFWINTPVLQAKYVYEQLSSQFTNDDIYENCIVLLYPWNKIRQILNILNHKSMHKELPIFYDNFNVTEISHTQKLSLVLYILERKHYFSGNGVWSEERNKNYEKM